MISQLPTPKTVPRMALKHADEHASNIHFSWSHSQSLFMILLVTTFPGFREEEAPSTTTDVRKRTVLTSNDSSSCLPMPSSSLCKLTGTGERQSPMWALWGHLWTLVLLLGQEGTPYYKSYHIAVISVIHSLHSTHQICAGVLHPALCWFWGRAFTFPGFRLSFWPWPVTGIWVIHVPSRIGWCKWRDRHSVVLSHESVAGFLWWFICYSGHSPLYFRIKVQTRFKISRTT